MICHYEDIHTQQSLLADRRGKWAIQWSFVGLLVTAVLQAIMVKISGSSALLADTIHNFGDAATAIPLWLAFSLATLTPTDRFTYGYGRVEDLVGVVIVMMIALSAVVAGAQSLKHLLHPHPIEHLWVVMLASVIGFLGNEAVARLRIHVGTEIGSAALVADGHHARIDGLTSLAVMGGAIGVWLGYPTADPLIGLFITLIIVRIAWTSGRVVFIRLLDGVDLGVLDQIKQSVKEHPGVLDVSEIRVRWLGHRLHAEINIAVDRMLTVEAGHDVAMGVRHRLLHELRHLSNATIHVDPSSASGEAHHRLTDHTDRDLSAHSH